MALAMTLRSRLVVVAASLLVAAGVVIATLPDPILLAEVRDLLQRYPSAHWASAERSESVESTNRSSRTWMTMLVVLSIFPSLSLCVFRRGDLEKICRAVHDHPNWGHEIVGVYGTFLYLGAVHCPAWNSAIEAVYKSWAKCCGDNFGANLIADRKSSLSMLGDFSLGMTSIQFENGWIKVLELPDLFRRFICLKEYRRPLWVSCIKSLFDRYGAFNMHMTIAEF